MGTNFEDMHALGGIAGPWSGDLSKRHLLKWHLARRRRNRLGFPYRLGSTRPCRCSEGCVTASGSGGPLSMTKRRRRRLVRLAATFDAGELGQIVPAPVAQLDRVLASEAKGHRFESCRARQFTAWSRRFRELVHGAFRSAAPVVPANARRGTDQAPTQEPQSSRRTRGEISSEGLVRRRRSGSSGRRRRLGRVPVAAGRTAPSLEQDARRDQAAFGSVASTALTLSTTTSFSSALVSR